LRDAWTGYTKAHGEADSNTLVTLGLLADSLRGQQRFTEAAPLYQQVLEIRQRVHGDNSTQIITHVRDLADILWKTQNYSQAIERARGLVRLVDSNQGATKVQKMLAYQSLAWWLAVCPDPEIRRAAEALALAQQAVEMDPARALNWRTLAMAQYASGDTDGAIESLNRGCQLNSGGGIADYLLLCMAHAARGDSATALSWYDKAMKSWARHKPSDVDLELLRAAAQSALKINSIEP
jgi:tetratricopeptide (TPR) repeat protein